MTEVHTGLNQQVEPKHKAPIRWRRPRNLLLLGAFLAPPVAGALVGTMTPIHTEQSSNATDLQKADGYERCLAFEKAMHATGRVTIAASQLSPEHQADCEVKELISDAHSRVAEAVEGANNYNRDPLNKIELSGGSDFVVTIRGPQQLETAISQARQAAKSVGISYPITGGVFGAVMGIVVDGAALTASIKYDKLQQ